jgi:GT2 family glycosyltransferase
VIIPAFNADETIEQCLKALVQQTVSRADYEIIVVDDGSSDETRPKVSSFPGIRLYSQPNLGPAAARNLGVQHAQGDLVLFTDADCVPAEDWIKRISTPFRDPEIVGAKGAYLTRQRRPVARFTQLEYEDKYDRMALDECIDFIDTYSAAYRREEFIQVGGFDTSFPTASVEDQELSFRLASKGCKMVFVPEARVHHLKHSNSLLAYWKKKFKIGYWKVLVHRRHPDKLIRDSHTPQVLKLQILLAGLGWLSLAAGLFWHPWLWTGAILALLFLFTTIPFTVKAWHRDRTVAAISPALLLVRSLALGTGFAVGLAAHLFQIRPREKR